MEELELLSLQALYELITSNLQPDYIIPHLITYGVLNKESVDEIDAETTDLKKSRKLMEFLQVQDTAAFWSFVTSLQENGYDFLAKAIEDYIKNPTKRAEMHKRTFPQSMVLGGVPALPPFYIQRTALVNRIRMALKKLSIEPGWAVVHGMGGCGKSVESAMAVRDPYLFGENFPGGIFWITIGQIEEARQLMKMQNLCRQLEGKQFYIPHNIEDAKNHLRTLFVQKHPKSLLVLDDVWASRIIKDFDIQCRILVTTRDRTVMDDVNGNIEMVSCSDNQEGSGFTLEQTKELFAKYLNYKVENLPPEVEELHDHSDGLPFAIALIAALLQKHKNRWEYYLGLLQQHQMSKVGKQTSISKVIELSVSNLEQDQYNYYKKLIVFDVDINVSGKVLSILWDTTVEGAEDIMDEFVDKSLAIKKYNVESDSFSYGLHQLHYHYLKETCSDEQHLHRQLIESYSKLCGGEFHKLQGDKYIYWFLAQHLFKAGLSNDIPKIFLNLKFILAKISETGTSDLLYTYLLYQDIIKSEHAAGLEDAQRFVETNTHFLVRSDVDPLQLALCQSSDSNIYQQALEIVTHQENEKLYLNWCTKDFQISTCKFISKVHSGRIYCACFIAFGTKVISTSGDSTIKIWYTNTGGLIQTLYGHNDAVRCCVLSKDGTKLITSSDDHTVRIWRLDPHIRNHSGSSNSQKSFLRRESHFKLGSLEDLLLEGHSGDVVSCDISNNGQIVASASLDKTVCFWNATTGALLHISEHEDVVNHCCFSPDSTLLASCSGDRKLILWNVGSWSVKNCYLHESAVSYCCFSSSKPWIASASDNILTIWLLLDGKSIMKFNTGFTNILCCDFSASSTYIAAGSSDFSVFVWSIETQRILAVHKGHSSWVHCVKFSEDDLMLLSASDDETVRIWDVKLNSITVGLKRDFDVVFTENSLLLVAPDNKNNLKIISGYDGQNLCEAKERSSRIRTCRISHNHKQIAYGCDDGTVKVLFFELDKIVRTQVLKGHSSVIKRCQFTRDDSQLVTCSFDCTLRLWSGGEQLVVYKGHQAAVIQCKIFSEDERILSASHDGTLRIWELNTGNCIYCMMVTSGKSVLACDISSDNHLIAATSDDKMVWIFNADAGSLLHTLKGHTDYTRYCCFSQNGCFLVSADDMGILKIWNLNSIQNPQTLKRHCLWVTDALFSPDNKMVVSAADNIKWWSCDGRLLQTFHVQGSFVRFVRASSDFKIFVTIDSAGILYILKRIEK